MAWQVAARRVEPDLEAAVVGGMAVDHEFQRRNAARGGFGVFPAGEADAAHRRLAAGADEHHRDQAAAGRQCRVGGDDPAELDHPAEAVLGSGQERPLGGRAGKADRPAVAAEVDRPRRLAGPLVDEAHRGEAVRVELAQAALRQQRDAGQAGVELQRVAVAGRPPADLAGAAKEAAAQLVAQGDRGRQHRPVDRRRPFAGGQKAGRGGARGRQGDLHHAGREWCFRRVRLGGRHPVRLGRGRFGGRRSRQRGLLRRHGIQHLRRLD